MTRTTSTKETQGSTTILLEILEVSKNGITKKEITNRIPSLSYAQLRRYSAELVDKRLLHYDELQRLYITTDRGLIFINNMKKS